MALHSRSGLFGFLLLLAALAPSPGGATAVAPPDRSADAPISAEPPAGSVEARLRRLSAALWEQQNGAPTPPESLSGKARSVAIIFVNGGWPNGWRNGGWGNGGFRNGGWRNGGWGNGGFRNGGWPNGFRNGGWRNGGFRNGGFRNGGFRNHW